MGLDKSCGPVLQLGGIFQEWLLQLLGTITGKDSSTAEEVDLLQRGRKGSRGK